MKLAVFHLVAIGAENSNIQPNRNSIILIKGDHNLSKLPAERIGYVYGLVTEIWLVSDL